MLPMRDGTTTSEDSATQLLICETLSIAKIVQSQDSNTIVIDFRNYFKNIAKHSDSMIEDGIATAAW